MKRLTIHDFGPLRDAVLDLERVNVITGMQSSGKSCILKTACFCAWVEKRIELSQDVNGFAKGSAFLDLMSRYYDMEGFANPATYIEYETGQMKFSFDNGSKKFKMQWKSGRWAYNRPKISYIPADRNLVAAVADWGSVKLGEYMVDFISNWDAARKFMKKEDNFLNLGLSYSYDRAHDSDNLQMAGGKSLSLKQSSSGVQSLLPMFVHIDYLSEGQYKDVSAKTTFEKREERRNFLRVLYDNLKDAENGKKPENTVTIDGYDYRFQNKKNAEQFRKRYEKYLDADHSEIFLEEPEDNLFPPTQSLFVDWLLDKIKTRKDFLFVTTHSPYILDRFIKDNPKDLAVFFTYPAEGETQKYSVKKLSPDEIREMYDGGIDIFFNFEYFL